MFLCSLSHQPLNFCLKDLSVNQAFSNGKGLEPHLIRCDALPNGLSWLSESLCPRLDV
ncbi:hypothetical protein Sjap_012963 [Stephania japonica]|uniref:Uncharacterized protein n=1 Tax=Stephania japonica TaxID=461633 RepID=A0AAP0IZH8_9MAGN